MSVRDVYACMRAQTLVYTRTTITEAFDVRDQSFRILLTLFFFFLQPVTAFWGAHPIETYTQWAEVLPLDVFSVAVDLLPTTATIGN